MDAAFLARCGVGPHMPGRAQPRDPEGLQALVPAAIAAARRHLARREDEYAERVDRVLAPYRARVQEWRQTALFGRDVVRPRTAEERHALIDALQTAGAPMLRLLAVLEPR